MTPEMPTSLTLEPGNVNLQGKRGLAGVVKGVTRGGCRYHPHGCDYKSPDKGEKSRELATVGHAREDFSEEAGGKQQIGAMLEGAASRGMLAASGFVWICICF